MKPKRPTIKNLLDCMPRDGLQSQKNQLGLYASLAYYYDGKDLKKANIRQIRAKQVEMDEAFPPRDYQVEEKDDYFLLSFSEEEQYVFLIPTLETMPEIKQDDQQSFVRESINKLAEDPGAILDLPYSDFVAVMSVLGKSLGIS